MITTLSPGFRDKVSAEVATALPAAMRNLKEI